ncbi:MAG: GNAT family N-acetyltransferase, partial [Planctomycetes bacterium]|nr:GNAT family N-acetyltransferase [Planctomycetota bacterium]
MAKKPASDPTIQKPVKPSPAPVPLRHLPVKGLKNLRVRPIQPHEIEQALPLLFDDGKSSAQALRDKTKAFTELARQENYNLSKQMVVADETRIFQACCFVPQEGKTAFVFTSQPKRTIRSDGRFFNLAVTMLNRLSEWAFEEGSRLLQVLVEPADHDRNQLSVASGFRELTELIYLTRDTLTPVLTFEQPDPVRWLPYNAQSHHLFKEIIKQTYRDSLDCPELENLRDMEDVLRGHKGAGQFDPTGWKLLMADGHPAGVLILSPLKKGRTVELTYMGLCPEARGKGYAQCLLAEALRYAQQ